MTRTFLQWLSLATLLSLCSGCLFGGDDDEDEDIGYAKLVDFEPRAEVRRLWSTGVGAEQDIRYSNFVPAIVGDTIITVDGEGNLYALDRSNGKRRWDVELEVPVSSAVSAGNGLLFVGTYNAEVIALNDQDGSEVWRATVSSEVLTPPTTNGQVVVVRTMDGRVLGLNHNSGAQIWNYITEPPLLTLRGDSSPVINRSVVYAGLSNGRLAAIQIDDGLLLWEQVVGEAVGRTDFDKMVDIDGAPLLEGDIVFAASYQGQIVALSRSTGRALWAQPESTNVSLASSQGNIIVVDSAHVVRAYGVGNGQIVWENEQLFRRKLTAAQAVGRYLVVADEVEGYLHVLDPADGSLVARRKVDGDGVRSPIVAVGDTFYVLSKGGKLSAFTVEALDS